MRDDMQVHVPCGYLRGDTRYGYQACTCESRTRWPGCDVAEDVNLCVLCVRGLAGGPSKWSWLGCDYCRTAELSVRAMLGRCVVPLGRHSFMNGVAGRIGDPESTEEFAQAFQALGVAWQQLFDWRASEVTRLALEHGLAEVVPLREWRERVPASLDASTNAYRRLVGMDPAGAVAVVARRVLTDPHSVNWWRLGRDETEAVARRAA